VACAAATRGTTATSPNNRKHLAIVRISDLLEVGGKAAVHV
jgi:hypothetical protein